jgi:hypothetical protein
VQFEIKYLKNIRQSTFKVKVVQSGRGMGLHSNNFSYSNFNTVGFHFISDLKSSNVSVLILTENGKKQT